MGLTSIGDRIAAARKRLNMSQSELAGKIGISPQMISKWERNESVPDVMTLKRLAAELETDLSELIGETEENGFSRQKKPADGTKFEAEDGEKGEDRHAYWKPFRLGSRIGVAFDRSRFNDNDDDNETEKGRDEYERPFKFGNCDADFSRKNFGRDNGEAKKGGHGRTRAFRFSNWKAADFAQTDLVNGRFDFANFTECAFDGATLAQSTFKFSEVSDCGFNGAAMSGCEFIRSDVKNCSFKDANLSSGKIRGADFKDCNFSGVDLSESESIVSTYKNCVFVGVNLKNAYFDKCIITDISFKDISFENTVFRDCAFKKVLFENCRMDKISYNFIAKSKVDLTGVEIMNNQQ